MSGSCLARVRVRVWFVSGFVSGSCPVRVGFVSGFVSGSRLGSCLVPVWFVLVFRVWFVSASSYSVRSEFMFSSYLLYIIFGPYLGSYLVRL